MKRHVIKKRIFTHEKSLNLEESFGRGYIHGYMQNILLLLHSYLLVGLSMGARAEYVEFKALTRTQKSLSVRQPGGPVETVVNKLI